MEPSNSALASVEAQLITMPSAIEALVTLDSAVAAPPDFRLVLPGECAWLQPALDRFPDDSEDYLSWVTYIRDHRKRNPWSADKTEVRQLARKIYQRQTMRARRRRLDMARELAELERGQVLTPDQRERFEASLVKHWIQSRDNHVAAKYSGAAPTYTQRIAAYQEFWEALDDALYARLLAARG